MLYLVYGSQTALQYSSAGLTKVLQAMCLMSGVHLCRFLLRNPRVLLVLSNILLICVKAYVMAKVNNKILMGKCRYQGLVVQDVCLLDWGWRPGKPNDFAFVQPELHLPFGFPLSQGV